jgi:hypothetical protein
VNRLPPVLTYSLSRLALFLVPFLVLVVLHVPVMWSVLIAFVLSSLVSIFLLSRQRDQVSSALVTRRERMKETMAQRTAAEDAWDDAARDASSDPPEDPSASR